MNIKGNTRIEGEAVVESLPISASSLSTLVEVGGLLHKRQFSDIVLQPKEAYIPGLSVSFPSIFNLNTESLDYNNRSLVVSLKNQLAGTALLAPVAMNGTPAFRRIVKSDLTDAGVVFVDDNSFVKKSGDTVIGYLNLESSLSEKLSILRTSNTLNASIKFGVSDGFFNLGIANKDIFAISDSIDLNLPTSRWMWVQRDGSIFSKKDGNSTQWNQAYKWGDFRDFGLGLETTAKLTDGNIKPISNNFGGTLGQGTVNFPDIYSPVISLSRNKDYGGYIQLNRVGTLHWKSWNGVTNMNTWRTAWDNVNLPNPATQDWVKNNSHLLFKTDGNLYAKNYYTYLGAINVDNVVGNISFYTSNNTVGSNNYHHHISYGLEDAYGYQLRKSPTISGGYSIRTRSSGSWLPWENIAYESWVKSYGLGDLLQSPETDLNNIDTTKFSRFNETTLNAPTYSNNSYKYGNVITQSRGYEKTQLAVPVISNNGVTNLSYRGKLSTGWLSWVKVWDELNLTKLSQLQNDLGYSTQTLTAGTNIQINGNVISATNTTYTGGDLPILNAGTNLNSYLWSAKVLNDWLSTKAKPLFELTPQDGIKVKDWNTTASGQHSVSIGYGSSATRFNSLALMQGATSDGLSSIAIGEYSQALGYRSIAIGSYVNSINESYSFGFGVTNTQNGCIALGEFNADIPFGDGRTKTNNSETPLFIIGNGLSSMVRSNAQVTYRDGSTRNYGRQYYDETMRSTIDFTKDNTLADVKYVKENGGGGLPNDPFTNISSNGYAGDTIDNPKFIGERPNNLDVVVLYLERGVGLNNWIKASSNGTKGALYGIYLSSHNKILLRGYYRNTNTGQVNNTSMLFDTASKQTLFMGGVPLDLKYVLLGNIVDAQAGLILFNPR